MGCTGSKETVTSEPQPLKEVEEVKITSVVKPKIRVVVCG